MTRSFALDRRSFVAALTAAATVPLAGCADPDAVLVLESPRYQELAAFAHEVEAGSEGAAVMERAVANDSVVEETGRVPSLDVDGPVRYDDTFYRVDRNDTVVGQDIEYRIQIEYLGEEAVEGEVAYENLHPADQRVLDRVLPEGDLEGFQDTSTHPYNAYQRERSLFIESGQHVVDVDGRRVAVTSEEGPGIDRTRYRYRVEEVAGSEQAFARWLRDTYTFTLRGLGPDEREIVETARGDGYYEGGATQGFRSLVRRFRNHRAIRMDERGGDWLVSYEEATYHAELSYPPDTISG